MAKYIIDLDAFMDCLDCLPVVTINDQFYTSLSNIKTFINNFPKQEVEETLIIKTETTINPLDE